MDKYQLTELKTELVALTVFSEIKSDQVITPLVKYITLVDRDSTDGAVWAYSEFVGALYDKNGGNLAEYILDVINNSENIYVRTVGKNQKPSEVIKEAVSKELEILQKVANLTCEELLEGCSYCGYLPKFNTSNIDLKKEYFHRTENIGKYGYGKYARHKMFSIDSAGEIVPVKNPDDISLDSLIDYEIERGKVVENTKALLKGKPAANILLTGDAGTGKSSTVKAVENAFFEDGLRMIEVRKNQLSLIPKILDELAENPLKFILFIDDISFKSDDDNFNGLKAVLEGSVSARSDNVVVYATSNRRHIVKERFADREGDEVHLNDTLQEMVSLSNRFGIHITFSKPNKQTFLEIVKSLAVKKGIDIDDKILFDGAERFALERGGRSGRLAKQYIEGILSEDN